MVSSGEGGKSDPRRPLFLCPTNTGQRTFSWTETIRGVILSFATYLKFLLQVNELKVSNETLVVSKINTRWLFRFHYPHSGLGMCRGRAYSLASHPLSKLVQGGALPIGLNTEFIHPIWGFPLCFDMYFFSFMKKHNPSVLSLYSDRTFSWGCQPGLLEKGIFQSHFPFHHHFV